MKNNGDVRSAHLAFKNLNTMTFWKFSTDKIIFFLRLHKIHKLTLLRRCPQCLISRPFFIRFRIDAVAFPVTLHNISLLIRKFNSRVIQKISESNSKSFVIIFESFILFHFFNGFYNWLSFCCIFSVLVQNERHIRSAAGEQTRDLFVKATKTQSSKTTRTESREYVWFRPSTWWSSVFLNGRIGRAFPPAIAINSSAHQTKVIPIIRTILTVYISSPASSFFFIFTIF